MRAVIVSLGGTPLAYGNVYDSSPRLGNFVAEYFCGYLRNNTTWDIDIIFFNKFDEWGLLVDQLKGDCAFFALDIVNYKTVKNIIELNKKVNPNMKNVLFGHFTTAYYQEVLFDIDADYCLLGDAENPGVQLLDALENEQNVDDVKYIASKNSFHDKSKAICMDRDRWPCFDFYENTKGKNSRKTHCLSLKNNVCNRACSFCWSSKGRYVFKSVDRIIEEIKHVCINYKVKDFYFTDNDILDYGNQEEREIISKVFDGIISEKLNISIFVFAKPKSINKKNLDLLLKMKKAGVYSIFIGVDAGNDLDLKLYNKGSTFKEVFQAIRLLKKNKIWYRIGFIATNPYTTSEKLRQNYRFLRRIGDSNYFHYGGTRVMLFKDTPLYLKVKKNNLLKENYTYLNYYEYKYADAEVEPIISFLYDELFPELEDRIYAPYFAVRRFFEMTSTVCKVPGRKILRSYEKKQRSIVLKYFKILFLDNNLEKARAKKESFIKAIETNSCNFNERINFYKQAFIDAPIIKK